MIVVYHIQELKEMAKIPLRFAGAQRQKTPAPYSFDSGTAFSAALKPIFECVPSQNGFSVEAPQRQSAIRFSAGNLFPSASINSTSPITM
jgi:hypothetical protein